LVELTVRDAWMGDTRYLASYDAMAARGELRISGRKRAVRSLSLPEIQELFRLAEAELLNAFSVRATCEDCVEYFLLVRVGDRVAHAILSDEGGSPPSEVIGILTVLGERDGS
jgi:hypothetical protein